MRARSASAASPALADRPRRGRAPPRRSSCPSADGGGSGPTRAPGYHRARRDRADGLPSIAPSYGSARRPSSLRSGPALRATSPPRSPAWAARRCKLGAGGRDRAASSAPSAPAWASPPANSSSVPIGGSSAIGSRGRRKRAPARGRGAHLVGRRATKQRGRDQPQSCALARRQDRRPNGTLAHRGLASKSGLDDHPSRSPAASKACSGSVNVLTLKHLPPRMLISQAHSPSTSPPNISSLEVTRMSEMTRSSSRPIPRRGSTRASWAASSNDRGIRRPRRGRDRPGVLCALGEDSTRPRNRVTAGSLPLHPLPRHGH